MHKKCETMNSCTAVFLGGYTLDYSGQNRTGPVDTDGIG